MKKIYVSVVSVAVCAVFLTPSLAFAETATLNVNVESMTIEQIEATIAKLQKQLEQLKKGKTCFVADAALSLGDGEESTQMVNVKRLQDFLREKGYLSSAQKSTGYFGKLTRASLVAFQKSTGIAQTGDFDEATRAKAHTLQCRTLADKPVYKEEKYKEEKKVENKDVKQSGKVESLTLAKDGALVRWSVAGYSASGFKVVWSKTSSPIYPMREGDQYQYFSNPGDKEATLTPFAGSGTYYVRVCEYLGGSCGMYSNQVTVEL